MSDEGMVAFWKARLDEEEEQLRTSMDYRGAGCALPGLHLDPERTRREIAANWAFLALVPWDLETDELMDTITRIRLTVWSDHPDYRPEWKP